MVDDDAVHESAGAANAKSLEATLASATTHPPSPLLDDDDLFSSGDFFSLSMPSFTLVVGVGMAAKPPAL